MIEKEIWQRFKDEGLKAFAVGVKESSEQASFWADQHGLTYPVVADPQGEIFRRFGGGSVPYHVVIDRDLRIALSTEAFEKDPLIGVIEKVITFKGRKQKGEDVWK